MKTSSPSPVASPGWTAGCAWSSQPLSSAMCCSTGSGGAARPGRGFEVWASSSYQQRWSQSGQTGGGRRKFSKEMKTHEMHRATGCRETEQRQEFTCKKWQRANPVGGLWFLSPGSEKKTEQFTFHKAQTCGNETSFLLVEGTMPLLPALSRDGRGLTSDWGRGCFLTWLLCIVCVCSIS